MRRISLAWALLLLSTLAIAQNAPIRLATTTSTENSGLLDYLLPYFTADTGYRVQVIAVGTGTALKYGELGDVDCVMVHSEAAELEFVSQGYGVERRGIMYNDFVILGPPDDPAGLGAFRDLGLAFERLAESDEVFVSRGDDSGTHHKELELWGANRPTQLPHYVEAGQGMANVLTIASEKGAYTLSDRGTYLAHRSRLHLAVILEGDPALFNPYSFILVNPARHPRINEVGARTLGDWLVTPRAQSLIAGFRVGGEQLFVPNAGPVAGQ